MCTFVVDGQRVAIAIEFALIGMVLRAHHGLALAEVDVACKVGIELLLAVVDALGKALKVGHGTDDDITTWTSFGTAEVEGKVCLVYIVVPLGGASCDGSIVDAEKTQNSRNLHLRILGGRRPSPQGGSLATHAIGNGLALIAIEHGAVKDFIVHLVAFIQFLTNRYP